MIYDAVRQTRKQSTAGHWADHPFTADVLGETRSVCVFAIRHVSRRGITCAFCYGKQQMMMDDMRGQ